MRETETSDLGGAAEMSRRQFVAGAASLLATGACLTGCQPRRRDAVTDASTERASPHGPDRPRFARRGIILSRPDLAQPNWPAVFAQAGLNTMAVHHATVQEFIDYAASPRGADVLRRFEQKGITIEFEHHVMNELLPRALFDDAPEMFRMDEKGHRTRKSNFCPSSEQAIRTLRENAEKLARSLPRWSGRVFFWPDDARDWCRCPKCRDLTDSDQNLILANTILAGVRRFDADATACCLAYAQTLPAPRSVKPAEGIFLEFAPIRRSYKHALNDLDCPENRKHVEWLAALLECFGTRGAQVLEYWLDASRHSGWKRPSKKLPDLSVCLEADMAFYARCGLESVTTFGVYLDADYWRMHGPPPIADYGRAAYGPS